MIRLLIIADDFTGALDTSVQLVPYGITPHVITNLSVNFEELSQKTEVLVVDTETRHRSPSEAYKITKQIVEKAVQLNIPHIYKKTDSALRGNIGSELTALMDATYEKKLAFIPALPKMGRCTVNGIHYIKDIPVAESVFGKEPFEPVKHSDVTKIIHEQSMVSIHYASVENSCMDNEGIYVFDASTQEELENIGLKLQEEKKLRIIAGCAGFGSVIPKLLGWKKRTEVFLPALDPRLFVVCGSVNPITVHQLDKAEECGFYRYRLTPEQKLGNMGVETGEEIQFCQQLKEMLSKHPYMIIDSNDEDGNESTRRYAKKHNLNIEDVRVRIAYTIGRILSGVFSSPHLGTLLITGGDVLKQCMDWMQIYEMEPIGEMVPGIVLSRFSKDGYMRYVISKSGGFGEENLINDLVTMISSR